MCVISRAQGSSNPGRATARTSLPETASASKSTTAQPVDMATRWSVLHFNLREGVFLGGWRQIRRLRDSVPSSIPDPEVGNVPWQCGNGMSQLRFMMAYRTRFNLVTIVIRHLHMPAHCIIFHYRQCLVPAKAPAYPQTVSDCPTKSPQIRTDSPAYGPRHKPGCTQDRFYGWRRCE